MKLTLFFTYGVSLQTWAQNGSLHREVALYRQFEAKGVRVAFITYGNSKDMQYQKEVGGIKILYNYLNLPIAIYARLIPLLHFFTLFQTDIIKTNQMKGAEVAMRSAKIFKKKFVARCGYLWSDFAKRANQTEDFLKAKNIEARVFSSADAILLTTKSMQEYVVQNYGISEHKINIIPNYVLTEIFQAQTNRPHDEPHRILSIGRLTEQKNLLALVNACQGLPVELIMIGEGPLHDRLMAEAKRINVNLKIHKNIPHKQIPSMLSNATLFALVSHYEGHPKALLEAMSCGVPTLVANSPGIREEVTHGKDAWVCGVDPKSIQAGIRRLLSNQRLRQDLSKNARTHIVNKYSLPIVAEREYLILRKLIRKRK